MNTLRTQLTHSARLLDAVEAVRNVRAIALCFATFAATVLVMALAGLLAARVHWSAGAVAWFLGLVLAFYLANAVGIMMLDEARGGRSRPVMAAILASLAVAHRLLVVLLLVGLLYLAGLVVMALLLLLCKIPGLGPALFTLVYPACAVVAGVALFALVAIVYPLAAPAVLSGAGVMQAVSQLMAIARTRLVTVVLMVLGLGLITMVVAGILAAILGSGLLVVTGLSAAIVGTGGGLADLMQLGMGGGMGGGGHIAAGAIGAALLWSAAFSIPLLVYARGCCQIYLMCLEGVDVGAFEQQMAEKLQQAREKAGEIRAKGEEYARSTSATVTPLPAEAGPASAATTPCPSCHAAVQAGDRFCGVCGHRMA